MQRFSQWMQFIKRRFLSLRVSNRTNLSRYERRRLFLEPLQAREVLAVAITALTPTPSGFVAELSNDIQQSVLNLYDEESDQFGAADVTLTGNTTGNVEGSVVMDDRKMIFIATGGALPADTYTVTIRSATNGIIDQALGELLDGEFSGNFPSGNGTPGGNFVFNFTATPESLIVSIPDFARGPTQNVQAPAAGSGTSLPAGLPIQYSNANGVTSFTMTITYDPALLTVTDAELGPDAPAGSQVEINVTTPGVATIAFFSLSPMGSGQADVVHLIASVPESATYGAAQVLDITFLEINAGAIEATADDALHVVAFPGDANANRRYDAEDARLIARTGVGLDTGFVTDQPTNPTAGNRLFPTIDPVVIGDVTGVDGLSPLDASDVLRAAVGLSTPNIPALPTAQSPTGLAISSTNVAENQPAGTVVGSFITTDPDLNDSHTYSLVAGEGSTNNALFTINGSSLRTAAEFDQATQSTLQIRVRTTDSTGKSFEKTFTINVTDANEAPTSVALSNSTVAENIATGTAIGTLTTTDPDPSNTHTYSLVSGTGATDNASFAIVGNALQAAATLSFETKSSYNVRIRSTDQGGLFFEQTFTITVTNVNEAPTAIALSANTVAEDAAAGTAVGTFSTTDPDSGNTHTYTLVAGTGDADNAAFTIVGNELRTAAAVDFETKNSYSIRVRSADQGGLFFEQTLTITVTNVNEAPTAIALSANTVAEDAAAGTAVGTFSTTDPDSGNTHAYSLVAGTGDADNAAFTIVGNELRTAAAVDFETKNSYSIRVRSADQGGLFFEQTLTITVTNVNEAPTAIALSANTVAEDAAAGTAVGTFSTTDPDSGNTHTYTLVAGTGDADNAAFTLVGNELRTAAAVDFETKNFYSIRVRSADQGGLFFEQTLTITVTNVNEAPTAIALSANTVAEDAAAGTAVGTFSTTDPDSGNTHTYTLVAGTGDADNAAFTIVGNELRTAAAVDFETKNSYSIRVRSADQGGLLFEQTLTITVTNVNEAPTAIALSANTVAEDAAAGTAVGTFSTTDPDSGNTHTYTLVAGAGDADNAAFTLVGNELRTAAAVDFETKNFYSIRVRSADQGGLLFEQTLTITVTNVNEAPTAIALSANTVAEDAAAGTAVGTFSTTDPDSGNTHTYTLVAGTGDADNAAFTIVGNELRTAAAVDFETKNSYSIRVRSLDNLGALFEQIFTITITDIAD